MDGVVLTPLKRIPHPKGDIFHAMKKSDNGFNSFGEAYFSEIYCNEIKGWKKHKKMTLNLVVPVGEISFVILDDREFSDTKSQFFKVTLSPDNYQRLTVPPGVWVAFKGEGATKNLLLNLASIEHDPDEAETRPLDSFSYDWSSF